MAHQGTPSILENKPTGDDPQTGSRDLLWKLLIALGSVVFLLVMAEAAARLVLHVQPVRERFQLSHQLGWEWTPGYDAVETYHGVDYHMQISHQELRNPVVKKAKPAGVYRIIALGDSITESPGVELEGSFVKLLEGELNDRYVGT